MRFENAVDAVKTALATCGLTPNPDGQFAIYVNFTTRALTLHRKHINYPLIQGEIFLRAKPQSLKANGIPKNDFWITGFNDFYQAFTFFIILWEILRCRYGQIFAIAVDKAAKPTPTFPL